MVDFDFSDLNTFGVDLGRASSKLIAGGSLLIRKTAYDVERDAKIFCPVDTGALRGSISTSAAGLSAEIGPTASYAAFVEEGTSTHAPQAFMGPAYDRNIAALVTGFEKLTGGLL